MNEEKIELQSRKTINIKELYKNVPNDYDKPSSKILYSIRKRANFNSSPKILPILNIKPPKFPKASDLFDGRGVRAYTIFTSRIKRFFIPPCKFTDLNRSDNRGLSSNRVQNVKDMNKSGVDLGKSKISLGKRVFGKREISNRLLNSKSKEIKGKLVMFQEVLMKVDSLSGWDAD